MTRALLTVLFLCTASLVSEAVAAAQSTLTLEASMQCARAETVDARASPGVLHSLSDGQLEGEREQSRAAVTDELRIFAKRQVSGPPTILVEVGDGAAATVWVDALRTVPGGNVVRSLDIYECTPDRLHHAAR